VNFQRGKEKEPLEINLVPMIDVMLVILIFLMITTTYSKYTELQINLPSARADRQVQRPNEVTVLVNAQGQYVVNRSPVPFRSIEQLADELRRAAAPLQEAVIRVMEAARLAGLAQITFTTQSPK
jgi:biopolymer transport protein ExbD